MIPSGPWRGRPPLLVASAGVHAGALAALAVSPASWRAVVAALVANHVVIGAAGMFPRSGLLGPNIRRLPHGTEGRLSLTFDDGPDPGVTPRVLDLLDGAGAKATFFCIGHCARQHPDLVASIRARGHGVENHTFSHPNGFALRGPHALRQEVLMAQDALRAADGSGPRFFRAPAGIQNPWLADVLSQAGLALVSWTRRGYDTVTSDARTVAGRLVRNLGAGDILLLHDGRCARDVNGRPVVLEALPRVLDQMARQNLRSVPLHVALPVSPPRTH